MISTKITLFLLRQGGSGTPQYDRKVQSFFLHMSRLSDTIWFEGIMWTDNEFQRQSSANIHRCLQEAYEERSSCSAPKKGERKPASQSLAP